MEDLCKVYWTFLSIHCRRILKIAVPESSGPQNWQKVTGLTANLRCLSKFPKVAASSKVAGGPFENSSRFLAIHAVNFCSIISQITTGVMRESFDSFPYPNESKQYSFNWENQTLSQALPFESRRWPRPKQAKYEPSINPCRPCFQFIVLWEKFSCCDRPKNSLWPRPWED